MISFARSGLTLSAALILAATTLACSSSSNPDDVPKSPAPQIPTGGDTASLKSLPGRWEGTYTNPQNGRKGNIVLDFSSGGKEARGDILMIPPDSKMAVPSPEETLRTMPQVYEINFIDAGAAGEISGTVGPYEDPQVHCQARSEFRGKIVGDTISGTFRTACEPGSSPATPPTSGTWSVTRVKKSA